MNQKFSERRAKIKKIKARALAACAYLFFFCIFPILLHKKDEFIAHHARHGLTLFSLEVATVLLSIIPFFGLFVSPFILSLCIFLSVWGVIGAVKNQYNRILFLSDIAQKIHL
ncbi:MAG: hypothetical protein NC936_00875 [Candidatus Omnitrophica bacterium]|nr:hypothetical protein [Candidatus Omnitrophota bacterium]